MLVDEYCNCFLDFVDWDTDVMNNSQIMASGTDDALKSAGLVLAGNKYLS